jgi:hypothetical protein
MQRWSLPVLVAVLSVLCGCGDKREGPPTIKAGGVVKLDGQPVNGAKVYFSPKGTGQGVGARAAYGQTGPQGQFTLETSADSPGALPGEYQVGIAKERAEGGMTREEVQAYYVQKKAPPKTATRPKLINDLPNQYKNPAKSGLTAAIKTGDRNEFNFDLKSK